MRVLVTGANGYIGSKVVKQLCDYGIEVIATDIINCNIDRRAIFVKADIFSNNDDWFNFFYRPDICLHLAWRNGFVHNSCTHMLDLSKHYSFMTNLIDSGITKIVCMGSMHEIGYWEGAINENTPCNPLSQYGIAKNALRKSIELYAAEKKCLYQWLRAFYIYGDDEYGNSIFCKIRQAVNKGIDRFPFTTGKNMYDFLHIDELAKQIAITVMQDEVLGIINICSGKPISLGEQVEKYIQSNSLPIRLEYGKYPDRPYDSPCIYGDKRKIEHILKRNLRILVTGSNGQLGHDCIRELEMRGYKNIKGIDINDIDLTKEREIKEYVLSYNPDIIMHNAAFTNVDKAELNQNDCYAVNVLATKYLAEVSQTIGAKFVYISTDYVFEGNGTNEYNVFDSKNGVSIYGQTKSEGEDCVRHLLDKYFIVRISWAFGINGNNFVKTMLKLADMGKKEISVVCDQIGSVTYTADLAVLLCDMIETNKYGIYHATNEGYLSWAEFAEKIFELTGKNVKVNYVTTKEYLKLVPQQAKRPLNSRMSKKSLTQNGFSLLPNWQDALKRFLKELNYNV